MQNFKKCLKQELYISSKYEIRKKAPLPLLPKPPFFHAFQTGPHPNERRHPFYRSPRFFTPCKLECTPTKEGTPTPTTKALGCLHLANWNAPAPLSLCHISLPFHFTIPFAISLYNYFLLQ